MKELLLKLVASDRKHLDGALLFLRLFIGVESWVGEISVLFDFKRYFS